MDQSSKTAPPKTNRPYHHGNIKFEAVQLCYEQIQNFGFEKLSLRQVARDMGIAHRALYNHFSDKEALFDAVATAGFNQFADRLQTVSSRSSFIESFVELGLNQHNIYSLMMSRPHATMSDRPELQTAVHRIITIIWKLYGNDTNTAAQNRETVMAIFFILHGAISLRTNQILDIETNIDLAEMVGRMIDKTIQ